MRRREFIAVLGGAAAAWPVVARAHQAAMPLVGYLQARSPAANPYLEEAFRRGLAEAGYVDGKTVAVEYRWAEDRVERLPALVSELVSRQVSVIAVFGTLAARAAKAGTNTIPVVFLTGDDPVEAGLVSRLNQPDGNLTGVTFTSTVLAGKRLELLRAMTQNNDLIAVLTDANSPESRTSARGVEEAARSLGQPILLLDVDTDAAIEAAFGNLSRQNAATFLVTGSPFLNARREQLALLAARYAVLGLFPNRDYVTAGGLMSYGASLVGAYRQAGNYVGQILKGTKLADLPVVQPIKFDLVINLKTARVLKVAIPDRLLALADEVIE